MGPNDSGMNDLVQLGYSTGLGPPGPQPERPSRGSSVLAIVVFGIFAALGMILVIKTGPEGLLFVAVIVGLFVAVPLAARRQLRKHPPLAKIRAGRRHRPKQSTAIRRGRLPGRWDESEGP